MCVLVPLLPYFKLPQYAHVYPVIHRTRKTQLRFPGTKHLRTRLSPLLKHLQTRLSLLLKHLRARLSPLLKYLLTLRTLAPEIYTPLPPHRAPKHENMKVDFFPISPFASGAIVVVWRGLHCASVFSFPGFLFRGRLYDLCVRSFFFGYCRDRRRQPRQG